MTGNLKYPSPSYKNKAEKIIQNLYKQTKKQTGFNYYQFNDKFTDDCPDLSALVKSQIPFDKFKLSAGTSDCLAFRDYLDQIISDLKKNRYYRSYNCPLGNTEARQTLALMENSKFKDKPIYNYQDFALTEGSTGAISQVFEFIKNKNPQAEVIIATPTYYLYKYLAGFYSLAYQEAFQIKPLKNGLTSFNALSDILAKINPKTRLITLVQPSNPSSQIYSPEQLEKLIQICQKKKILLLVDELFSELIYNQPPAPTDLIARKLNALNNIVIVKGYSKSKNLAGFRIGYLFSKNKELLKSIEKISEGRQCFAAASCFTGVIALDSFIQTIKTKLISTENLNRTFKTTKKAFSNFSPTIANLSIKKLKDTYRGYSAYNRRIKNYYSQMYDRAIRILKKDLITRTPKISAFNTFIKIRGLEKINQFDFCLNLYLCTNLVTQIGPCFAFDQKRWQTDPELGFWLRLSYSRDKEEYAQGLKLFLKFKKLYLANPNKFLKTNLTF
ncbi:MAG: pyridoxal phosphate-dependent aminotransferase [Candidatus Pacebacteria bacterium]|nr:pyridoxal phosphate-dependent aminotransferase [Candidatus Paceibacterota bacterium]